MKTYAVLCCATIAVVLFAGSAGAQEVVHALSGTVTNVNPNAKTLQLTTNDGSEGTFAFETQKADVNFNRDVRENATPVTSFNKLKDTVVVFYFGNGTTRTVLAVQDLGQGPFDIVEGTVAAYNKHQHQLSISTGSGKTRLFNIDQKAVADTMNGAVPAIKFEPQKGDNVRVIANKTSGTETALFVRD